MLYFLRITPVNYAYAWWLSLRQPVGAWRIDLPDRLARRFTRLRPHDFFTFDEWLLLHDACFDNWQRAAFPALSHKHKCTARQAGSAIDFSVIWWQIAGIEFERLSILEAIVARAHRQDDGLPTIVEPWLARAFDDTQLAALFPRARVRRSAVHRWIEGMHQWAISFGHCARMLLNFLRSGLRRRKALGRRKVVWTGISAQEIASNDGQLNFAWVTQYGHLPADEVIYFLPVSPDPAQRAYLSRQRVAWVEPKEAFSILAWRRRLRVAAAVLAALLKSPFAGAGIANVFLARFLCRVSYWRAVVEEFGIDRYFTTTSACWPEAAEVVLLKNLGVKSVTWSYSANSMRIARKAPAFRDVNVTRSLLVTDELWVWNEAHCVYYDKRRVSGDLPAPRIRVTGSMMCGDARSLARDAAAARRLLGIREAGFLLSVFDIATVDDEWRAKFDGGPVAVNLDFAEAFFAGLRALLDALPALVILLKLKRKIGSRFRAFPDSLLQLVADDSVYVKSGRIETVDVNCDPYLPVAACDAAIGMPCTSPVLLAASLGRPAAYFDPLGIAGNIPLANLRGLCIREEGELIERTARWIAGAPEAGPPLPHDVNCTPAWTNERGLFAAHAGC